MVYKTIVPPEDFMFLLYNVKTLQCCVVQSYIRVVLRGRGAAADWRGSVVTVRQTRLIPRCTADTRLQ